jgi:multidrug efflux pump subunit AcrB
MLHWGGIPKVDITGFATRELHVGLNPVALQQFGISVTDVARAIETGSIETNRETLLIRVAALGALVVRSSDAGGRVLLREIANITEDFSADDDQIFFDGRRAAVLDITKTRAEDSLDIIDQLKSVLASERQRAPPRRHP